MEHDLLAALSPALPEDLSSQPPSVASSSPTRTSTFSHSSALSDTQITALDVLEQPGVVGQGSSIAGTLKTGFKHVSALASWAWTPDAAEEVGEALVLPSARVMRIQQTAKEECGVVIADAQQLQLWEFNLGANVPLLRTTVEERNCVDALLCGSNMAYLAVITEVVDAFEEHDLKIVEAATGRMLWAQRLAKPGVGVQSMGEFLLVQHAVGVSVYRMEQLEFVRHVSTASSVISTSGRWLAFEGLPAKLPQDPSTGKAAYDVGDTARTVVAGIVGLSKAAHKHLSPMLKSHGQDSSTQPTKAARETRSRSNSEGSKSPAKPPFGWVGIYHVHLDARPNASNLSDTSSEQYDDSQPRPFELQQLANFHASSESLAAMQFSPGGTKLACAPASGQVVLVYNLVKPHSDIVYEPSKWAEQSKRLRVDLAFKLVRGYTPSRVLSLQFSTREDRLCAVSSRGTVHVFDMPKPKRPESTNSGNSSTNQPAGAMSVDKLLSAIPSSSSNTAAPEQQALFRIKFPRRHAAQPRTPSSDDENGATATMYALEQRRSSHPGAGPASFPPSMEVIEHNEPVKILGAAAFVGQNSLLIGTTQSLLSMYSFSECAQDSPLAVWNSSVEAFYAATGQKSTSTRESLQLVAKELARWDLETMIPVTAKPASAPTSKQTRGGLGTRFNWLQYVTDETSQPPLVPLWLRPPVNLFMTTPADPRHGRGHPVFTTPRANQQVTVRRLGPVAMQPSNDEPVRGSPPQLTSVLGTSPLYGTLRGSTLPSNMLQDTISKAMGTELRPDKRLMPPVSEDSRLFDGNSLTYTSDDYFRPDAEPQPVPDAWNNADLDELDGIFQFDEQRPSDEQVDPPLDLSLLLNSIQHNEPAPQQEEPVDNTPLPLDGFMDMTLEDINAVDKLSYQLSTSSSPDSVKDAPAAVPAPVPRPSKSKRRQNSKR